jgi:hypothetical protein
MHPDDRYVVYRGRRMLRVAGGSPEGDAGANGGAAVAEPGAHPAPDPGANGAPAGLVQIPDDTPAELRPILESYIREKVDPQVTRKFQEAAELRDKFGPLSEIQGLDQMEPDTLSQLVAFAQMDEEQFNAWYGDTAKKLAESDPDGFESMWNQIGQDLGYFEDDDPDTGGQDDPKIQELQNTVNQLSQQLTGFLGQQERTDAQQAADQALDAELGELQQANNEGNKFDEEFEQDLYRMAAAFANEDQPLHKAFERLQRLSGQAQTQLVTSKLNQPPAANGNGRSSTEPEQFHTVADAREAAVARLKASR